MSPIVSKAFGHADLPEGLKLVPQLFVYQEPVAKSLLNNYQPMVAQLLSQKTVVMSIM